MNTPRLHARTGYPVTLFAALTLSVIALSTAFLLWDLRARELDHGRLETVAITRVFLEQTARTFESADLVLGGVQDRLQSSFGNQFALDSLPVHILLGTRVLEMRQLDALYLVDPAGQVINSSLDFPAQAKSVANRGYFQALLRNEDSGLYIDNPVLSGTDKGWTLSLARRITGPDGKLRGIIVGAFSTAHFEDLYKFLQLAYVRPVSLYRDDGILIASLPHRENMIGARAPEFAPGSLASLGSDIRFSSHAKGNGEREAFTLVRVPKFPLVVSVTNDDEEAIAAWRETAVPIVLVAMLMSIFIIVAARVLMRELVREQKLAQSLGEANQRYHQTVDSVMDAIVAIDEQQNIVLFNPAAERMFGLDQEAALGAPIEQLLPERLRGVHRGHVDGFMRGEAGSRTMGPQLEIIGVRADGSEFPIESTISHGLIDGKPQLTAVLRDVTERRRAEKALQDMNQQLRGLSASLQSVREHEQTRISRELHDELGQQLTGLKLDLSWLGTRVKEGRPPSADRIDDMRHQLDRAIAAVRRISTELRPLLLDDLGFGEAVKWQSGEFTRRTGIDVSLNLTAVDLVTGDELPTALFRIVQESLTNIARHAHARKVEIQLFSKDGNLVLAVTDDGLGISNDGRSGGFGLVGMRERSTSLGGDFQIISSPGAGTTVQVELSLDLPMFEGVHA